MSEAVERALQSSPALEATLERARAADAHVRQAGTAPNPALNVELENFGGTGRVATFEESEMSLGVSQRIERGGKLSARVEFAIAEKALLETERERIEHAVVYDARVAFVDLVAAQYSLTMTEAQLKVAEDIERLASRRVSSARDPLTVKLRAQVATAEFRSKREQMLHDLHRARRALANLWGESGLDFEVDMASFLQPPGPLSPSQIASPPDVRERQVAAMRAQRKLDLERSNARSDVSVSMGVRRFERGGDVAGLLSLSVPIMLFDDNQGNIDRAAAEYGAAMLDVREAERRHKQQLLALDEDIERSRTELRSIIEEQLPLARDALAAARRGYDLGAFAFSEIAEAHRVVVDLEGRKISALRTLHLAHAGLSRLTGHAGAKLTQPGANP